MKKLIVDDKIVLIPMTSQLYHIERKNYIADPMMCETPYIYTPEIAQKDFERKANNCNRVWFAILLDDIVIGDVYLKNIDLQKGSGTLSIVLIQNCYKEKGYGTAVERTVLEYGFKELGLSVIYADVVLRNTRSQHVLEKIGFEYLHEDSFFKYYKYTCKFCSNGTPILKLAVHSFWFSGTRFLLKTVRFSFIIVM